jgi:hypothetical protein
MDLLKLVVVYFIIVLLSISILVLGVLYLIKHITIMLPGILLGIGGTVYFNLQIYLCNRWLFCNNLVKLKYYEDIVIILKKIILKAIKLLVKILYQWLSYKNI